MSQAEALVKVPAVPEPGPRRGSTETPAISLGPGFSQA